jgi:hypothetical protein
MASIFQAVEGAVGTAITTIYIAFVGAGTRAILVSLHLTNTTAGDITVDAVHENAAGTQTRSFGDDVLVPAKKTVSLSGPVALDATSEKIRLTGSAAGVEYVGVVVES